MNRTFAGEDSKLGLVFETLSIGFSKPFCKFVILLLVAFWLEREELSLLDVLFEFESVEDTTKGWVADLSWLMAWISEADKKSKLLLDEDPLSLLPMKEKVELRCLENFEGFFWSANGFSSGVLIEEGKGWDGFIGAWGRDLWAGGIWPESKPEGRFEELEDSAGVEAL